MGSRFLCRAFALCGFVGALTAGPPYFTVKPGQLYGKPALQFFYLSRPGDFERAAETVRTQSAGAEELGIELALRVAGHPPRKATVRLADIQRTSAEGPRYLTVPEELIRYQLSLPLNTPLQVSFSTVALGAAQTRSLLPETRLVLADSWGRFGGAASPLPAHEDTVSLDSPQIDSGDLVWLSVQLQGLATRGPAGDPKPKPASPTASPDPLRSALPYFWLLNDRSLQQASQSIAASARREHLALEFTLTAGANRVSDLIPLNVASDSATDHLVKLPSSLTRFLIAQGPAAVRAAIRPVAVAATGALREVPYRLACTGEYNPHGKEPVVLAPAPEGSVVLPAGVLPPGSTLYLNARLVSNALSPPPETVPGSSFTIRLVSSENGSEALTAWKEGASPPPPPGLRLVCAASPRVTPVTIDLKEEFQHLWQTGEIALRPGSDASEAAGSLRQALKLNAAHRLTIHAEMDAAGAPKQAASASPGSSPGHPRVLLSWSTAGGPPPSASAFVTDLELPARRLSQDSFVLYLMLRNPKLSPPHP